MLQDAWMVCPSVDILEGDFRLKTEELELPPLLLEGAGDPWPESSDERNIDFGRCLCDLISFGVLWLISVGECWNS